MALNGYYDAIGDLVDALAESFQGKYGIVENYANFTLESYKDKSQLLKYFESLAKTIVKLQEKFEDTYIQNQIDTVTELIYSTKYKIENLG